MLVLLSSLLIGLAILLIGSNLAIGRAVHLSTRLKISPLIIGTTVVAIGTSLPELLVSVIAQLEGSEGLSLANIVGSNIANFGIVLAAGIFLSPLYIGTRKTQSANIALFFITSIFTALVYKGYFKPVIGMIFIIGAILYLVWQIKQGEEAKNHEDRKLFTHISYKESEKIWLTFIRLFITLSAVVLGSKLVVESSVALAHVFGRKAAFFGLTVIAVGTSLPELATTIVGSIRGESKLVAGNLIGSNILNMLLIGGVSSTLGAHVFTNTIALLFMIGISFMVFVILLVNGGRKIHKLWGVVLLVTYLLYLFSFAIVRYA